ncbi:MAG: hypothetical protein ACHQAX_07005 [Gammaproteobacteria bacterium]
MLNFPFQMSYYPIQHHIAPVYYTCPEDNTALSHLPDATKALVEAIPSILLDNWVARELTMYYKQKHHRDAQASAPILDPNQNIHFIVCDDRNQGFISKDRARHIIQNELAPYFGEPPKESHTHHSTTVSGSKNGQQYIITFFYGGLNAYLSTFNEKQRYLIDLKLNLIVLKNRNSYAQLFQTDKVHTTIDQQQDEPEMSEKDDTISDIEQDELEEIKEENEDNVLPTFDIITTDTSQSASLTSSSETKPVASSHQHKIKKKVIKEKPLEAEQKKNRPAKIEKHTEQQEVATSSSFFPLSFSHLFYGKKIASEGQRRAAEKLKAVIAANQAPTAASNIYSASLLHLREQLKVTICYMEVDPKKRILNQASTLNSGKNLPTKDTLEALISTFQKAALDNMNQLYKKHEAPKQADMKNKVILRSDIELLYKLLLILVLVYAYVLYELAASRSLNTYPNITLMFGGLASFGAASGTVATKKKTNAYLKEDYLILSSAWDEALKTLDVKLGKKNAPCQLVQFASILLIMQRIKEHQKKPKNVDDDKPLHQFLLNFTSTVNQWYVVKSAFAGALFLPENKSAHLEATINTLVGLLAIHGEDFLPLAYQNNVPEINIPTMPHELQIKLMEEKISAIESLKAKPQLTTKEKHELVSLADALFLVYQLRSKSDPTTFIADFEKKHQDFLKHSEAQLKDDSPECIVFRSMQFSTTLKHNPDLALRTLEAIALPSKPQNQVNLKSKL